jgi:hypothetical protein
VARSCAPAFLPSGAARLRLQRFAALPAVKFEKKNTAPSIKVDGLDLTDKPVTIFHGKMFTPRTSPR